MKYMKLSDTAVTPVREHDSAGYDLFSDEDYFELHPQKVHLTSTGIAVAIPEGHVGLIMPKSGLGHKEGLILGNVTGVIDSDYRGELMVSLWNRNTRDTNNRKVINKGSKIAQMIIVPISTPELIQVGNLDDTVRGNGGFGSTGS